jgi:hypothetical protein
MSRRGTVRLLALWALLSVPCIAVTAGCLLAGLGKSGFFFDLPPEAKFIVGAWQGGVYALLRCLPHFLALYLWVALSRFFGDIDISRARILVGMAIWALPEAIVFTKLAGPEAFLATWLALALGCWLPRALVKALRPGVFQQNP